MLLKIRRIAGSIRVIGPTGYNARRMKGRDGRFRDLLVSVDAPPTKGRSKDECDHSSCSRELREQPSPRRAPVAHSWPAAHFGADYLRRCTYGTTAKVGPATNLVQLYLIVIAGEWALVFYVWRGIRRSGVTLRELIGGNWSDARAFGRNFAIAVLFWFVWEGSARAMHLLLGPSDTANVTAMLPRNSLQIVLWCLVSCTAGFCEEVLYRGYLQHQFAAWTGGAPAAIAIQAVIFGASHGYQGTKQMVIISVLGALYGILANWRRTLVPGMAAHVWSDIYGGWLHP
jgi:membrane protease YdiL (CAAX protease family)